MSRLADRAEFLPYVYGAASGWPSRGRPEKVLANPDLPQTPVRRLAALPDAPVARPSRARKANRAETPLEAARKDREERDAAAGDEVCGKRMTARAGGGVRVCGLRPHESGPCRSAGSVARRSGRKVREDVDEEVAS